MPLPLGEVAERSEDGEGKRCMMKRMGISPDDLEGLNNEMMQAFGGAEEMSDLPSPPPQPPSPPNGYYKKFSLKNKQKDRPAWPGDPFSGFTEFAHRRARKRSNPFFAAACTPQKALCA